MNRIALLACAALWLAAACSGDDKKDDKGSKDKASDKRDTKAPPKTGDDKGKTADKGTEPDDESDEFDASALCTELFPPAEVAKILGVESIEHVEKRGYSKTPDKMAECQLEKKGETFPEASVKSMIDCRSFSQKPEMQERVYKSMDGYKELDIGKAAWYATQSVAKVKVFQINFMSEVGCNVMVSHSFIEDDHVEELARFVHGKLTKDNAPLK